jgi:ankyrin repeat protein
MTALMLACFRGNRAIVSILISHGAELNIQNHLNGWTALMYSAACRNHEDSAIIARMLLDNGADRAVRNRISLTCIDIAVECENQNVLFILSVEDDDTSYKASSKGLSGEESSKSCHTTNFIEQNILLKIYLVIKALT